MNWMTNAKKRVGAGNYSRKKEENELRRNAWTKLSKKQSQTDTTVHKPRETPQYRANVPPAPPPIPVPQPKPISLQRGPPTSGDIFMLTGGSIDEPIPRSHVSRQPSNQPSPTATRPLQPQSDHGYSSDPLSNLEFTPQKSKAISSHSPSGSVLSTENNPGIFYGQRGVNSLRTEVEAVEPPMVILFFNNGVVCDEMTGRPLAGISSTEPSSSNQNNNHHHRGTLHNAHPGQPSQSSPTSNTSPFSPSTKAQPTLLLEGLSRLSHHNWWQRFLLLVVAHTSLGRSPTVTTFLSDELHIDLALEIETVTAGRSSSHQHPGGFQGNHPSSPTVPLLFIHD